MNKKLIVVVGAVIALMTFVDFAGKAMSMFADGMIGVGLLYFLWMQLPKKSEVVTHQGEPVTHKGELVRTSDGRLVERWPTNNTLTD